MHWIFEYHSTTGLERAILERNEVMAKRQAAAEQGAVVSVAEAADDNDDGLQIVTKSSAAS